MSKNAAQESELGLLHSLVAKKLTYLINQDECDPRHIQAAIKFLNDNNIKQVLEPGNDISELDKDLQKRKQRFGKENIADIATERAKKEALG